MSNPAHHLGCMRYALAAVLLTAAIGSASAAPSDPSATAQQPDQYRLMQTARALVRLESVGQICPPFYPVDAKKLAEIQGPIFRDAVSRFGKERLHRAVNTAEGEFADQIREGGASTWCPAQRSHFDALGVHGLIGQPRK